MNMKCKVCGADVNKLMGNGECNKCFMVGAMGEYRAEEEARLEYESQYSMPENDEGTYRALALNGKTVERFFNK